MNFVFESHRDVSTQVTLHQNDEDGTIKAIIVAFTSHRGVSVPVISL